MNLRLVASFDERFAGHLTLGEEEMKGQWGPVLLYLSRSLILQS